MTVAAQAQSDARRGAALIARFANAVATFAGGETVEGIFERLAETSLLGGLSSRAREISFECSTAALPANSFDGACLSLAMGSAPTVAVGAYRVQRGGRVDDLEELTTLLQLELA